MTAYFDKDRRDWRARLHRIIRRYRALLVALVLLAVLLPSAANAAPRCPGGTATPNGCSYVFPGMTCAWPLRLVKVGNVAYCWYTEPGVGR